MGDGRKEGYWEQCWKEWEEFIQAERVANHQGEIDSVREWLRESGWTEAQKNRWVNGRGVGVEIKEEVCWAER